MFNSKILILWINIKGEVKEAFKKNYFQLFFFLKSKKNALPKTALFKEVGFIILNQDLMRNKSINSPDQAYSPQKREICLFSFRMR